MNLMQFACSVLIVLALGCSRNSNHDPQITLAQNDNVVKPRHIHTELWTNMPPPSEADVNLELADAVGEWITINGGPHKLNGKAAIWIPENTVIVVPDRVEWTDAPSHRSHLMVTGILKKTDGQYELTQTSFEWLDQ